MEMTLSRSRPLELPSVDFTEAVSSPELVELRYR